MATTLAVQHLVNCQFFVRGKLLLGFLALFIFMLQRTCAAEPPSLGSHRLVVFGDSYEDSGLLLRITQDAVNLNVPHAVLTPAGPDSSVYWQGRWSNGPSMVELFATKLGYQLINYAVGGAKSDHGNYDTWVDGFVDTGLAGQIGSFEESLNGKSIDPNDVFVLSASTNDYCQFHDFKQPGVLGANGEQRLTYPRLAQRVAANMEANIRRLLSLGAQRIIVFSAYDIAAAPQITQGQPPQVAEAKRFVEAFDEDLSVRVHSLSNANSGVTLFPIGVRMREIADSAGRYGLQDIRHACQVTVPVPKAAACKDPDHYFWWDEIHPTARVHALLAEMLARETLKP